MIPEHVEALKVPVRHLDAVEIFYAVTQLLDVVQLRCLRQGHGRVLVQKVPEGTVGSIVHDYSTSPRNGNPVNGNCLEICLSSSQKNGN